MRDFTCQVRKHDSHHLELKTLLPIPNKGRGKYDLSFYFFSPGQLHMTKEDVGVSKILKHFQTNTRFSSPVLPLAGIIDPNLELSPLYRLKKYYETLSIGGEVEEQAVIYEMQTLVNAFRSDIKGFIDLVYRLAVEEKRSIEPYKERISSLLDQTDEVLRAVQELSALYLHPRVSDHIRTALVWTDEAISLIAEQKMIGLRSICEHDVHVSDQITLLDSFIAKVSHYRGEQRYSSAYSEDTGRDGERVAYRESILKKWSQSAMYMNAIVSRIPNQVNHILAGMAAALAMTFAVLATLYAETFFIRNSAPWVLIIIISYVFKDRIKEILREVFAHLLPRLLADKIMRLQDPATGKDAAKAEVIVKYGLDKYMPEFIRNARDMQKNPFASILPPQDVLHFNRIVTLNSKILKDHNRLESLTEVTRVRIDEWLNSMDDPDDSFDTLQKGKLVSISSGRVYHIHLIVSLKAYRKRSEAQLFHYCLVMNRKGLLRIEQR